MNLFEILLVAVNLVAPAYSSPVAPKQIQMTIEGDERVALVDAPESAKEGAPIVFAFHGHGGTMRNAMRSFDVRRYWPEAVVIYPQGLKTMTKNDPEGGRPGWQNVAGIYGDRDLKFFDALLKEAKDRLKIDPKRVFVMGHSNGGGFSYLLMRARPSVITAFGPSSAGSNAGRLSGTTPKPVFHIAGTRDPIVPFEGQKKTMDALIEMNGCKDGEKWSDKCTFYPSDIAPVATYISDATHNFQRDAMPYMIRFFKAVSGG